MGVHDGHRERLRNRFLTYGMDTLEDHEVLELLLFFVIHRHDTNELAHRLLDKFGSLPAVMDASISELTSVVGIGPHAAHLLLLCKPLCRRYMICQNNEKQTMTSADAYIPYLKPYFFGMQEEHAFLLCLDAKGKPICCRELSEGSATTTMLPIRKASQLALDCKAASVILAHNHPGGDTTPSSDDYRMTSLLKETLEALGIQLIDHVVICGNHHNSMAQAGFFY